MDIIIIFLPDFNRQAVNIYFLILYSNNSTLTSLVINRYRNLTTVLSFPVVKYPLLLEPLLG